MIKSKIFDDNIIKQSIISKYKDDIIILDDINITKDKGSVLIYVSNDDIGQSLSNVFRYKANAVILCKDDKFDLVDALGNLWCRTNNKVKLLDTIFKLYQWNKSSIRKESVQITDIEVPNFNIEKMNDFCKIVHDVSNKVENERGIRFFGNTSTRCSIMFPSFKSKNILVSKRNISKKKIQPEDFVITEFENNNIKFHGEHKPSVDTPGQILLYQKFKNINFMIHGHAYIKSDIFTYNKTKNYCSCGDLREVDEIINSIQNINVEYFIVNLKNHGFIIGTNTIEKMKEIVISSSFIYREIGEEKIIFY